MPTISFETKLFKIGQWTILLLPEVASKQLPARAMAMVTGAVNGAPFKAVLEPDGRGSHWFKVDATLQKEAKAKAAAAAATAKK